MSNQLSEDIIIANAYDFFLEFFNKRSENYDRHKFNKKTLKFNPFTVQALAKGIGDVATPKTIAKALVYPYALGTSISTAFGTKTQQFIVKAMGDSVTPSIVTGMDIEYIDQIDNRKKYCQLKAGPTTINKDDIETICNHFKGLMRLGITNHLTVSNIDCVTGVLYGEDSDLSSMYLTIRKNGYVVSAGQEFWYHLTGYKDMYQKMIKIANVAAGQSSMKSSIEGMVNRAEQYISENKERFGIFDQK